MPVETRQILVNEARMTMISISLNLGTCAFELGDTGNLCGIGASNTLMQTSASKKTCDHGMSKQHKIEEMCTLREMEGSTMLGVAEIVQNQTRGLGLQSGM